MTTTGIKTLVGANIKGTPKMSRRKVAHDLRALAERADVLVKQEFKWRTYWLALGANLRPRDWRSFPSLAAGLAAPVRGAQGISWRRTAWDRRESRVERLHRRRPGMTETRHLRAVLLADPSTGLACWHGGTHMIPGGDADGASEIRRAMLEHDLARFAEFLDDLLATGHPVVWHMDANVRPDTWAYERLVTIVDLRGGLFHGERGVEYVLTFDGADTAVEVDSTSRIRPGAPLHTDHEARVIRYRLVSR